MRVLRRKKFNQDLEKIVLYIAKDSANRAIRFKNSLKSEIEKLPDMPFKCRASYYYDDENVRDMIFKGYTIPYLVDPKEDVILILEIFKWVNR